MAKLSGQLILDSCPHCGRANPVLTRVSGFIETKDHARTNKRWWAMYKCTTCGDTITAGGYKQSNDAKQTDIRWIYPSTPTISESIPDKAREFLRQAQNTFHAPAGAIMLCASAIDAMLKEKGYTKDSLYKRIDKATADQLITDSMAKWAHEVRLDANEQRHADKDVKLPDEKDAKLTFDFAIVFAEYLFVLPSKVERGIADATAS